MTILNPTPDILKSVAILNSDDYPHRYADATKAQRTENDSVTIETLLRSIDGRLQTMDGRLDNMDRRLDNMDRRLDKVEKHLDKVGEDIIELKVQTAAIGARLVGVDERLDRADERFNRQEERQREADRQLIRFEGHLARLPSWKSVGTISTTVTVGCGGLFVWLADGGAKTLARWFE
jgi:chromosome segregation ATPase